MPQGDCLQLLCPGVDVEIFVQKTHRNAAIFDVLRCWLQDYAVITRKEKPFDPGSTILHLQRPNLVCLKKDTVHIVCICFLVKGCQFNLWKSVFNCQPLSPIYLSNMVWHPEGQWLSELLPWSPGELNAREVLEEAPVTPRETSSTLPLVFDISCFLSPHGGTKCIDMCSIRVYSVHHWKIVLESSISNQNDKMSGPFLISHPSLHFISLPFKWVIYPPWN